MPLMLAWYFHKHEATLRLRDYLVASLLLALPVLLIARQPDLGTALLVTAAGFYVIFLAGLSWKILIGLALAGCASLPPDTARPRSHAIAAAGSRLARLASPPAVAPMDTPTHTSTNMPADAVAPAPAAFRLLPNGDHALDARLALVHTEITDLMARYGPHGAGG